MYALRYNGILRYDRVADTSTRIAVTPGKNVNLDVSAVFADGSYSPGIDCGTARTTDTSSGGCVSQALDGAIQVDYPAIDGAVAYVFALRVNSGPVFYNRVEFTSLRFEIGSGATGHTTISAVFADGTSTEVATCASVAAN